MGTEKGCQKPALQQKPTDDGDIVLPCIIMMLQELGGCWRCCAADFRDMVYSGRSQPVCWSAVSQRPAQSAYVHAARRSRSARRDVPDAAASWLLLSAARDPGCRRHGARRADCRRLQDAPGVARACHLATRRQRVLQRMVDDARAPVQPRLCQVRLLSDAVGGRRPSAGRSPRSWRLQHWRAQEEMVVLLLFIVSWLMLAVKVQCVCT